MYNKTFIDLCLQGKVLVDQIDDYVDEWHDSDTDLGGLNSFLGMAEEEYNAWVHSDDNIYKILYSRKYGLNFSDVLAEDWSADNKIAARSNDISMVRNIKAWLSETA